MGVRTLYLVRHGDFRKRGDWGELGPPLTAVGREQAMRVGKALRKANIDAVHCSTLTRAVETATIIGRQIGIKKLQKTPLLCEGYPVAPPGERPSRADAAVIRDHRRRLDKAFGSIFKPTPVDRFEIVVAHGNVIRYYTLKLLGAPLNRWIYMGIHCASITRAVVLPGREFFLISFNDYGHIPRHLRTRS